MSTLKHNSSIPKSAARWAVPVVVCLLVACTPAAETQTPSSPATTASAITSTADISKEFGATLAKHVDDHGMVNYAQLKSDPSDLDAYVGKLANLPRTVYNKWSEPDKIAFWINAYNGLTLKAIIDHYPIKSSFTASLRFPKNSIRQIKGVWNKLTFSVMGRSMTLDDIEHGTLRKQFYEPRVHMALVCAAMGCPPLRNEPYIGSRLDNQLDDQARRFFDNTRRFRIDRAGATLYLSPILDWFGGDFVKKYATQTAFTGHSTQDRAILNFVSKYISAPDLSFIQTADFKIKYLDYDWSLNEQKGK